LRSLFAEVLEDRRMLSVLAYSTYWGGSRNEEAADVAADSEGNTYVIGTTESPNLGGNSGPDALTARAFLTKFDADGQVEYSTVLGPTPRWDAGGFAESFGFDVIVGEDDRPIIAVEIFETTTIAGTLFPVPGPHYLHVAKLSELGAPVFDAVVPLLDSPGYEDPYDYAAVHLAAGNDGSTYVTYTALRTTTGGGAVEDTFISKLASDGSIILTKRLFAAVDGLAVDADENIYLAMSTSRDDLPVTAGAYQPENAGLADLWIAKLDPTASGLYAATYLGGSEDDMAHALALRPDQPNVVYIVGSTKSDNFPLQNPLQEQPPPGPSNVPGNEFFLDAFITAIDLTVSPTVPEMTLVASTYFGGSQGERLTDLAFDSTSGLVVVGSTNSMPMPLASPIQPEWNDGPVFNTVSEVILAHDLVVARFDAALTGLEFSTYFGGSGHDSPARLAVDANGTIHLAATTSGKVIDIHNNLIATADFPVLNAVQPTFGGGDPSLFVGGDRLLTDAVVLTIAQRGILAGLAVRAVQGRAFNGVVAAFTSPRADASPADFTATINWGDGSTSQGTVTPDLSRPRWFVRGLHQYAEPGAYAVVVEVEDQGQPLLSPVRNIDVSHWDASQTGGAIAVDPTNPDRVFIAMTDEAGATAGEFDGGLIVAPSGNRGADWAPRKIADADDDSLPPARKNPDVLFDDFGNLFLAYQGSAGNNIIVAWSTDGGFTFDAANVRELEAPGSSPSPVASLVGSPKLAFGAANNEIWVTFEDRVGNRILAAGAAVGGLGDVGDFELKSVNGSDGGLASDIAVGPAGDVAVIWQTSGSSAARLLSNFDLDGLGPGDFSVPTTVSTSSTNGQLTTTAQQSPVPLGATLAWDTSYGPHGGRLHAAYIDLADDVAVPPGPQELTLFTTFSDDLGVNWSTPRRVTLETAFQSMFLPSIAFDPVTGSLAVGWHGTRGSLATTTSATNFFVATSKDGVDFSTPQQVTVDSSDALDARLTAHGLEVGYGEAPGLAYLNGLVYPVWSDNSNLQGENYFPGQFEVATAILGVIDVRVPPVAIRPQPIQAVNGEPFDGAVASFTHPDTSLHPAMFTATIHWGDGLVSLGTVTQPGGPATPFIVTGSHVYAQAGAYPLWVEVQDNLNNIHALPVSNVSAQQGTQSDPSIAVDPTNPDRVFATSTHANLLTPVGISVAGSDDGGATWSSGTIADGKDGLPIAAVGTPRVAWDQYGNLFLTYLTAPPVRGLAVVMSTDGGATFTHLATFTDVDEPLMPSITVGPGEGGTGGSVWLSWQRDVNPLDVIMVAGAPVFGFGVVGGFAQRVVTPLSPDLLERSFADVAVGPAGQVLVSYVRGAPGTIEAGPAEIVVQLDPDGLGPAPLAPAVLATSVQVGIRRSIAAQEIRTINTQGGLAWDTSDGQHTGRVYLVYTDAPNVDSDDTNIFIIASDDNGQNWSEPIQVHDDDPGSQFLPSIAVDRDTGNVGVAWYTTVDTDNVATQFSSTISDDGGSTFRLAYRVSAGDSDATDATIDDFGKTVQFGRKTGLVFVDGVLQSISADNSNEFEAVPDPRRFDIANARVAVAEVSRAPLVVDTQDIGDVEGNEFTARVATFTDPDGPLPVASYRASIDWGDGSEPDDATIQQEPNGSFAVVGTHEYTLLGHYTVSVTIKAHRTMGEGTATATIANAPLDLVIPPDLRVVRELDFTEVVATLTDLNPHSVAADFIATIEWGDGVTSLAMLELEAGSGENGAPNTFNISGTHKYLAEQTFTIQVSLIELPSSATLAQQGQIVSGDPPLVVDPGQFLDIEALVGINTGGLVLVTFVRADDIEVPLDTGLGAYTATIKWGDGQVDTNVRPFVTDDDVTVSGGHTYTTAGEYFPLVTLVDDSGGVFSVPLVAKVQPDVTSLVSAVGSGLIYNPATERFVGQLTVTNTSAADINGPLFMVFHDLPAGVTLANVPNFTGEDDAVVRVDRLVLRPGESLDPIELEFENPSRVPISYRVQVFDGVRSSATLQASLAFEANLGQANGDVAFAARGPGYGVFFGAEQITLSLKATASDSPTSAAVFMQWSGGNDAPNVVGLEPQAAVSNYFIGSNPADWITHVPNYGRIRYESVYDGIALEYYGREGELEYDWIVEPGADPSQIMMRFAGADEMAIDSAGNLRLTIGGGQLVQRAPFVYQEIAGKRREIAAGYVLHTDGTVTFDVGAYDPAARLVIDPVLLYSTYFGGTLSDSIGNAIAVDDAGNTYVTGIVDSYQFTTPDGGRSDLLVLDLPTSANAFQPESIHPAIPVFARTDAFVVKLDPQGVPLYSTYLSGNGYDEGRAIAADSSGHAYVAGFTGSTNFPTRVAFQPNGLGDGFLVKLSPDGSRLVYSTYLGGVGIDVINAVAVDADSAVYVAGTTNSPLFPTKNGLQGPSGDFDGFLTKFDPSGSSLAFSTYLGGSRADEIVGVALDGMGHVVVAGITNSLNLATPGALFNQYHVDPREAEFALQNIVFQSFDAFVAKLPTHGSAIDVLTYLGGTGNDFPTSLATDVAGNVYVAGHTDSQDLPLANPLHASRNGLQDGFVIELDSALSSVPFGTYLGGNASESDLQVAIDPQGNIIVAGSTNSADLPTIAALQSELSDASDPASAFDWFLASIDPASAAYNYLTYLGGNDQDVLNGLAVDRAGNAIMTGVTSSGLDGRFDFPRYQALQPSDEPALLRLGRMTIAKIASEPPPGFNRLELTNLAIAAVEGIAFNDVTIASFISVGTEQASDFTASIEWGDGTVTAGAVIPGPDPGILGRRQFNVLGSHVYADIGHYDISVTVRDTQGNRATAPNTTPADGVRHVGYRVAIDTAALRGQSGFLSVQFNPGASAGSPDASLTLVRFVGDAVLGTNVLRDGESAGDFAGGLMLGVSAMLNRLSQSLVFGDQIEFDVEISGDAIASPSSLPFGDVFAVQLLAPDGVTPLLTTGRTGAVLTIAVDPNGATRSRPILPDAVAARSVASASTFNRAAVSNAPLDALVSPFSVQEGAEFSGVVATFTNSNPFETLAGEHAAMIDWGDGTPPTAGAIVASVGQFIVTATHTYRRAGEYPLNVTVVDPDGAAVPARVPAGGNRIEAARPIDGALTALAYGDFNGDGRLDVAGQQFLVNEYRGIVTFGNGDFTFAPRQSFDIPIAFTVAAAGDFDGDGVDDLVGVGGNVQTGAMALGVMLGRRMGVPSAAPTTTTRPGFSPASIVTADVDSDGHLDVVLSYLLPSQQIDVFRGRGDGTFLPADSYFPGIYIQSLAAGDLNDDGHPDIVAGSQFSTSLVVLLGTGGGSLGLPTYLTMPAVPLSLATADMNVDGILDVVVGTGELVVLTGAGDGTFTAAIHRPGVWVEGLAIGDLDRDGRPDVVASDLNGQTKLLLATADDSFEVSQTVFGVHQPPLWIADFNGDAQLDLAARLRIFPGGGNGTVDATQTIISGDGAVDAVTADVNDDGFVDLVAPAGGRIAVTLGHGDGTFDSAPQLLLRGGTGLDRKPTSLALADFNGDGRTDFVAGVTTGTFSGFTHGVTVVMRNADGSYASAVDYLLIAAVADVAAEDVNGDGNADIVAAIATSPGRLAVLLNVGDGSFGPAQYLTTSESPRSLLLRDLNGDGAVDIAVRVDGTFDNATRTYPNSGVQVFHGVGDGTFFAPLLVPAGALSTGADGSLTAGDLNGDSILDLVVAATGIVRSDPANPTGPPLRVQGGLYILLGNPDGTYRAGDRYLTDPAAALPNLASVALADFNRDGKLDVAATRNFFPSGTDITEGRTDDLSVLLGNGDGTFGPATEHDFGRTAGQLMAGDLNGDGAADLVTAEPGVLRGDVYVRLGKGDGTFDPTVIYLSGIGGGIMAMGDLDGDGRLDVATANRPGTGSSPGTIGLLLGKGDGTLRAARLSGHGGTFIAVGDANEDGLPDVAVSGGNGIVSLFLGNGSGWFSQRSTQSFGAGEMVIGDIEGDGQGELLVFSGSVIVLPIGTDGSLGAPRFTPTFGTQFAAGDFNGDGRLDVARVVNVFGTDYQFVMALGQSNGTFLALPALPAGKDSKDIVAADFNGDGRLDVAIANAGVRSADFASVSAGGVRVLLANGDGTFQPPTDYQTDQPFAIVDAADLNGDGWSDIVAVRGDIYIPISDRNLDVMYNRGDGTFAVPQRFHANQLTGINAITTGDFAGDGLPEIVVAGDREYLRVVRNVTLPAGARVTNAPIDLAAQNLNETVGTPFAVLVGSFFDDNPLSTVGDFSVTIDWGDGASSVGIIAKQPDGRYQVTGSHAYAASGTFQTTISLTELPNDRYTAVGQAVVAAPPLDVADAGPDQTVGEGTQVTLNGSFVNSDPSDVPTFLWQVTSTNGQLVADGNAPAFNFTPNDNGIYTVSFTVTTGHGVFSDSAIITVTNVAPTALVSGPASGTYGQNLTYALSAQDLSSADQLAGFVLVIHWGDGTPDTTIARTAGNATGVSVEHVFASAGQFMVQVTSTDKDGDISDLGTLSVEIGKAHLSVTANNKTKVYGTTNPPLTATIAGFVDGQTLATSGVTGQPLLTLVGDGVHAGNYVISVALGSLTAPNYDFPAAMFVNGTLEVTPAGLTIRADNKTKLYGAVLPALTASFSGFVNGDTPASLTSQPTIATTATVASHVGNYPISTSGAASTDYTIEYLPGTLSVTPAPLTIRAEDKFKVYGAAIAALTAAYEGLVNGDNPADLSTPPSLSTTATAASNVGVYPISIGGALDNDYEIDFIYGLFEVTPAPLAIKAQDKSKLYGAAIGQLTAVYDGLVNGDTPASLDTPPVLATGATAASSVGEYPITAAGAADMNYTIRHLPGAYHITPAPLTIKADDKTKTAGSANPPLTYTAIGLVNGDTPASLTTQPTLTTTATLDSPVGNYPIIVAGAASPNYEIDHVPGTLAVTALNRAPVAVNDTANTNKNTSVVVNVLSNDSDPDGTLDPTSVAIVGAASHGTTSVNPTTGAVTYTPAVNYTGMDSFTYKVKDNRGTDSNVATVSIAINAPPVAVNDKANTSKNTAVVITVLSNDSDPDGTLDPTSVAIVAPASHGTTSVNPASGAITYTPALNYTGTDCFTYKVKDNRGTYSNVATVLITVNAPPVAVNDTATTNKNTVVVIGVLSNDSDPDGTLDPTSVTIVSGPSHGTASVNPTTGAITYTPALNYTGADYLTYKMRDNRGTQSNVAMVSITVRDMGLLHGMTATIGFWQSPNGQALIKSFGKTSSGLTLANWLANSFPNLYGGTSKNPNYLVDKTNAQVASLFVKLFNGASPKADAQVMATALAVFTTTKSLNTGATSRAMAAQYGFTLSDAGTGTAVWNVGSNGGAFGLSNNSTTSILDLLKRVNARAVKGKLYNGDNTLITKANVVFSQINEAGDIAP